MSGWGANQPTGLVQTASVSIGSGNTATLISPTANGVRITSLSISSQAVSVGSGASASFAVEDVVNDTNGVQYGATEIGLPAGVPFATANSTPFDEGGIVVPAGVTVQLVNGGAGGTGSLRRCSASASYIILEA
jgi:predicted sugar kinase